MGLSKRRNFRKFELRFLFLSIRSEIGKWLYRWEEFLSDIAGTQVDRIDVG